MRSFKLSVAVLGGLVLLAGLSGCAAKVRAERKIAVKKRVKEAAKKEAAKKEAAAAQPQQQQQQQGEEPKSSVVTGYGETASAARANALYEAQDWLEREMRGDLKPGWSVPRRLLEPAYLEKMGVINVTELPATRVPLNEVKDVKGLKDDEAMQQQYKVTLTSQYVKSVYKESRDEWVAHESQEREDHAKARQHVLLRVLGGVLALLLVVAGYLRLEEATRGYYTTLLRVAALGFLATVVLGLLMIG